MPVDGLCGNTPFPVRFAFLHQIVTRKIAAILGSEVLAKWSAEKLGTNRLTMDRMTLRNRPVRFLSIQVDSARD